MTPETPPKDASLSSHPTELSAQEVAAYIEQMVLELYHLARSKNLGLLAYFLSMAHMEADEQARAKDNA